MKNKNVMKKMSLEDFNSIIKFKKTIAKDHKKYLYKERTYKALIKLMEAYELIIFSDLPIKNELEGIIIKLIKTNLENN